MNNEFEKFVPSPPEEKQEQVRAPEQLEASHEISEAGLQAELEQALGKIDSSQNEVIANADKRIENVPASSGLSQEKAIGIYEQGGFANRIKNIKEKIIALAQSTREKIKTVVSKERLENPNIENSENESKPSWFSRIKKIREVSKMNLENILERYQLKDRVGLLDKEKVKSLQDNFKVTINISDKNILKALKGGRIKSSFDTAPLIDKMTTKIFGKTASDRTSYQRKFEEWLGISPEHTRNDPPLVYGAVASNPNDYESGPAQAYGKSFLVLKDSAKKRATFTYGDSMSAKPGQVVTEENVGRLKSLADRADRSSTEQHILYIEAQIAGGVSLEDIEKIRINVDSVERKEEIEKAQEFIFFKSKHPEVQIDIRPFVK
ncbi:MAG: hypothetical protein AAB880_01575 [Patescibacteria group bacterium]